jgi:hypothetical protein
MAIRKRIGFGLSLSYQHHVTTWCSVSINYPKTLCPNFVCSAEQICYDCVSIAGDSPMKRNGDQVELNTEEASGGTTPHIVRYILAISLFLAILSLSAVWITGAVTFGN